MFLLPGSVDSEKETTLPEPKAAKETIDLKEIKRVDHILASLQRKVSCYTTFRCFLFNSYVAHHLKFIAILIKTIKG